MIDSKKLANMLLFNDMSKMSAHQPTNVVNITENIKRSLCLKRYGLSNLLLAI